MADWKDRLEEEIQRQSLDMKSVSRRAGLGDTYIRDVLRRGYGAGIDPIARIAQVLGVSVDWLITGTGEARGGDAPIPLRSHDSVEVTVVARALYAYRPL